MFDEKSRAGSSWKQNNQYFSIKMPKKAKNLPIFIIGNFKYMLIIPWCFFNTFKGNYWLWFFSTRPSSTFFLARTVVYHSKKNFQKLSSKNAFKYYPGLSNCWYFLYLFVANLFCSKSSRISRKFEYHS